MADGPTLHPLPGGAVTLDVVTRPVLDAVAAGDRLPEFHPQFPREDDRGALSMAAPGSPWASWVVRRAADGLLVGTIGFFGPPEPAEDGTPEVEVGYGLVDDAHGQGLMTAALHAALAETDRRGVRVRGGTTADNAASLALMRRAGFVVRSEDPTDPDREVVLVRAVP